MNVAGSQWSELDRNDFTFKEPLFCLLRIDYWTEKAAESPRSFSIILYIGEVGDRKKKIRMIPRPEA